MLKSDHVWGPGHPGRFIGWFGDRGYQSYKSLGISCSTRNGCDPFLGLIWCPWCHDEIRNVILPIFYRHHDLVVIAWNQAKQLFQSLPGSNDTGVQQRWVRPTPLTSIVPLSGPHSISKHLQKYGKNWCASATIDDEYGYGLASWKFLCIGPQDE